MFERQWGEECAKTESLEKELERVKTTLSETLAAKKIKAQAEQAVAKSYGQIQQEGDRVVQEESLRNQELEKMDAMVIPPQ